MAEITASLVKELRDATGISMLKCKNALEEASGDLEKAREILYSIFDDKNDDLIWYNSLPTNEKKSVLENIKRAKSLIAYLYSIAGSSNDEIALKRLQELGAEEIYKEVYGSRR